VLNAVMFIHHGRGVIDGKWAQNRSVILQIANISCYNRSMISIMNRFSLSPPFCRTYWIRCTACRQYILSVLCTESSAY